MKEPVIDISIVIAAYNEGQVISRTLDRVILETRKRPELSHEIICVNDGSHDDTGDLIKKAALNCSELKYFQHKRNFGQGRALRTGFEHCSGDVIVTLDADLSYGPEYIHILYDSLKNNKVDICLASPFSKQGDVRHVPILRRLLSRYANLYLAKMIHYPIKTCTSVVRAYSHEAIDNLMLSSDGMELLIEILMKASLMGFSVCEVPAVLEWAKEDTGRKSKMKKFSTIWVYLFMGWLSKPAFFFMILALLLLIMGLYLGFNASVIFLKLLSSNMGSGFTPAVSNSMRMLLDTYYYGIFFSSLFLMISFVFFVFSLLFLQNRYYFEEQYKILQNMKNNLSMRNGSSN